MTKDTEEFKAHSPMPPLPPPLEDGLAEGTPIQKKASDQLEEIELGGLTVPKEKSRSARKKKKIKPGIDFEPTETPPSHDVNYLMGEIG
eukprot:CAMPEP_0170510224 /NCGR_PEP_ID=MMETSP0208-20121228/65653_1 /TAXON_ID=197538 /ORGANISM="Strombidium inclinatum, Strain S3" /LENGTH=88 /DNA_ID=CAMNT_0010793673 /DNA_START=918 /DNA_END=1181 /DNA_ORIENTATION=-